jgi:hypothetical protein
MPVRRVFPRDRTFDATRKVRLAPLRDDANNDHRAVFVYLHLAGNRVSDSRTKRTAAFLRCLLGS